MSVQRKHISETGKLLIPVFADKTEMLDYFGEFKNQIHAEKMSAFKMADAFGLREGSDLEYAVKASTTNPELSNEIQAKLVINATNLLDTHKDVHQPGIWKKGLAEAPPRFLLKEHKMTFENEISKELKAFTETTTFKDLGYPRYKGTTEILVFDARIRKSLNDYMFRKYALGEVDNHSVGMQYRKMFFCLNTDSREWKEEKDNWDKWYSTIANPKDMGENEFFWSQTEAKAIEGSAVLGGSCWTTPTLSVSSTKDNEQPNGTQDKNNPEQPNGTPNRDKKRLFIY